MEFITYFYAQILGIYITVVSIALILNPQKAKDLWKEAKTSRALMFFDGALALLFGILLILTHNNWSNLGASIVSSISWLMFTIGVIELLVPHKALVNFYDKFLNNKFASFISVVLLAAGIYMILFGFGFIR